MRRAITRNFLSVLLFAAATLAGQFAYAQGSATIEVKGRLVTARTFSQVDFSKLLQTELAETRSLGTGRNQSDVMVKWRGVLLRDLLTAAGMQEKERHDLRRSIVIARATDGYIALFSWGELMNTKLGDSMLVITAVDGKPLADAEGPFALRSLADIRPGPRHVKWLQQIEVVTLD